MSVKLGTGGSVYLDVDVPDFRRRRSCSADWWWDMRVARECRLRPPRLRLAPPADVSQDRPPGSRRRRCRFARRSRFHPGWIGSSRLRTRCGCTSK